MAVLRILVLSLLLFPWSAFGQPGDTQRFSNLVSEGVTAYKSNRFAEAVKAFREAYQIKPDPTLLFNIGRASERMGAIEDAIAHYQAYVDAPGTTTEGRSAALEKIAALKKEKAAREAAKTPDIKMPALPPLSTGKTKPPPPPPPPSIKPPQNTPPPKGAGVVVLVNVKNKSTSVTRTELKNIFMGRKLVWGDGTRVKALARPRATKASKGFFKLLSNLSFSQYDRHWQREQLAGSGMAPRSIQSTAKLLQAIGTQKGGIGFVHSSELPKKLPPGIRIITIR